MSTSAILLAEHVITQGVKSTLDHLTTPNGRKAKAAEFADAKYGEVCVMLWLCGLAHTKTHAEQQIADAIEAAGSEWRSKSNLATYIDPQWLNTATTYLIKLWMSEARDA